MNDGAATQRSEQTTAYNTTTPTEVGFSMLCCCIVFSLSVCVEFAVFSIGTTLNE